MTTQELHIELEVLLQKINSHWNQNFLPAEKDLFLNREITKFINRKIDRLGNKNGTGLYDTIKRTVELSPLLKTISVPVIYNMIQKEVKILLPFDFLYYVSSEVSVCCSCKNLSLIDSAYYIAELSPIKNTSSLPLTIAQGVFNTTIKANDIPSEYLIESSVPIYTNQMMITNALDILLKKNNELEVEVVYDKVKNRFLFRSSKPFTLAIQGANGPTSVQVKPVLYKNYNLNNDAGLIETDVIDGEFKTKIKKSYLSGAKPDKALVEIRDKELIYTLNGVIADYVNLTYICQPSKIDLLLQSNSELNDSTLEAIVGDTAQKMMSVIGSDGYAKFVEQNTITE